MDYPMANLNLSEGVFGVHMSSSKRGEQKRRAKEESQRGEAARGCAVCHAEMVATRTVRHSFIIIFMWFILI